ncbi:MAG: PAS domain S-box protein [Pyrinomonadaceae bacterium MAG19_C2-C3]|nr:PAS domain S-box protein [Pyrinomonadaceae bacterium MAG19_C2-C3]
MTNNKEAIPDRLTAELEKLRASEERYRVLAETASDAIITIDETGTMLFVNPAAERIFGYSRQEMLGRSLTILIPDTMRQRHEDGVRRYLATGRRHIPWDGYELPGLHKSGREIALEISFGEFTRENRHYFTGVIRDISGRKRLEEELRQSEEWLRALLSASRDGILVEDEGQISYVNEAYTRMLGYDSPEELIGTHVSGILSPDDAERMTGYGEARLRGESPPTIYEFRGKRKDGSLITLEATVSISVVAGKTYISTAVRDITERKQAEEKLRLLGSAVQQANDPVLITTPDLDLPGPAVVFINPAFTKMTGYTPEEIIGKTPRVLQGAKTERAVLDKLRRCLSEGKDFHGETVNYRKDGTEFWIEWNVTPVRNASGETTHFIAIQQDSTERRKMEQQSRQAQKMEAVGQLAGGVAHDFNNLLTVITGYSDLALRRIGEADPLRRNIGEIKKAADRAAALTRQLLAFSRKQPQQLRVLNINEVVGDTDKMLGRLIGEDIGLASMLDPALGQVKVDPGQLEQVIVNLVLNARDAMPNGGKITIETKNVRLDEAFVQHHLGARTGRYVMLAISDTGMGMDAETQARIFEPFFTTKEAGKGTGLGLSTVYGIVKQSDGYISVYSEVGHGTTFKVYLPRVDEVADPPVSNFPREESVRGTETVLLVEDEEIVRSLARQILEMNGYKVLEATDGVAALRLCERNEEPIHLLLTDMVMPQMSGRELSERLSKLRPDIPVLYMSGYTDDALMRHGMLDANVAFLEKPFTPESLVSKVREVLDSTKSVS